MKYFYFLFFIFFPFVSLTQIQRCSTEEYKEILKKKGLYRHVKTEPTSKKGVTGNYSIPVVVHVLYHNEEENISDERIYSQIDVLNDDYNNANSDIINVPSEFTSVVGNVGISFCLVQQDLNGNSFSGINRVYTNIESFNISDDAMKKSSEGGVDAWDTNNYLNFWVCNLTGNLLGFATMPGDAPAELDGVVIDYEHFGVDFSSSSPYNLGRTGTHEVGHYFNLEHTFYAGCSDWDGCSDTPAISSPSYGCPTFPEISCGTQDMTMNYMDYANDACMYMFTECQANTMLNTLTSLRSNLIVGDNCTVSIDEGVDLSNSIYPNPVVDIININVSNAFINLYDIYGRHVLSEYNFNKSFLDISNISSGYYILYINNASYKILKK